MPNGKVLIAGGFGGSSPQYLNTLEVLDLAGRITSVPAVMSARRYLHTATVLRTGKVLITGGRIDTTNATATVDLYDPATGSITSTGSLNQARFAHTATLLNDGRVLIAGGTGPIPDMSGSNTAEIYNPVTGTFSLLVSTMSSRREFATATRLSDGRVLVSGGSVAAATQTRSMDIFNPVAGTFTATADLITARSTHSATMLEGGTVLIAGGLNGVAALSTTEIFNPADGSVVPGPGLLAQRTIHIASLLPDGSILIAGGFASANTAEVINAGATASTSAPAMTTGRFHHAAAVLPSGKVLLVGGNNGANQELTMELYDGFAATASASQLMLTPRRAHTATLLKDGRVLIAGGEGGPGTAELFDPETGIYSPAANLVTPRINHNATVLTDGRVLFTGGSGNTSAEIYDPVTGQFSATGDMQVPRPGLASATLLLDGRVFIAGGRALPTEIYDPVTGTFMLRAELAHNRSGIAAVLLRTGEVLLSGGESSVGAGPEHFLIDVYDPQTNSFVASAPLVKGRSFHTMAPLSDGRVLIAGGLAREDVVVTWVAEIYDRQTNTSTRTGDITFASSSEDIVPLPDGTFLTRIGLYDPLTEKFVIVVAGVNTTDFAVTPLLNGTVLFTGGSSGGSPERTTRILTPSSLRPYWRRAVVDSAPVVCRPPSPWTVSGSGFVSPSEGSSGSLMNSAADPPLLRFQRLQDGRVDYVVPSSWSSTSLTALPNLPIGLYRVSIVTNVAPSAEKIVGIENSAFELGIYPQSSTVHGLNKVVAAASYPAYLGSTMTFSSSASAGFNGFLSIHPRNGTVTVTNPRPVGSHSITVTATTACGTRSRTFTLTVNQVEPPTIAAAATSSAQVRVAWPAVEGGASYNVFRGASPAATFTHIGSTTGLDLTNSGLSPNTTYFYIAETIDNAGGASLLSNMDLATTTVFSDDPLQPRLTTIRAAHITQLRTAVNAVRAAASLAGLTYTDTPLSGLIKAIHIQQLRAALNEARTVLGFPPVTFTQPATQGSIVYASDVTEIRNGVK